MSLAADIELAILNCVDYILNTINGLQIPIIWAYEGGAVPDEPYVLLNHISGKQEWSAYKSDVDTSDLETYPDGKQTIFWTGENQVSINAYGPDCMNTLSLIYESVFLGAVEEYIDNQKISIIDIGNAKNVSIILDDQAEKRAALDLRYRFGFEMIDSPGYITGVDLSSTINE